MTELARRTLLWLATIAIGVGCGATNPPHASVDPPPPVGNLRRLRKSDMVNNAYQPRITVDPETYVVEADGKALTCEPATSLPMAQRYFLF